MLLAGCVAITPRMSTSDITSLQKEGRKLKPSAAFSRQAHIQSTATYRKLYAESLRSPQKFWARMAKELHWFKPWKKLLSWDEPFAKDTAGILQAARSIARDDKPDVIVLLEDHRYVISRATTTSIRSDGSRTQGFASSLVWRRKRRARWRGRRSVAGTTMEIGRKCWRMRR